VAIGGRRVGMQSLVEFVCPSYVVGVSDFSVKGAAPLYGATSEDLSFCNLAGEEGLRAVYQSKAGVVICFKDVAKRIRKLAGRCVLGVENPRLVFARCLREFFREEIDWGIHPSAIIEKDARISGKVYIGPFSYIGHGAEIGEGAVIEYNVYVGARCKVGRNVYLQYGAVVGCEGQGFERNESGQLEKFPQFGCVVLRDEVEVGSNSTIVRGTFSETIIGKGTKIGHLTDIGHNVTVGESVFISAGVVVCGSAAIGDHSWLAPKCCVQNKVKIGRSVTVGLGAVVTQDVADGMTVVGIPARPMIKKR
jgi:UDP-3-O-[3-hydroxymyristoyl] glucosamine N-acyltransferase